LENTLSSERTASARTARTMARIDERFT
jgi:hypothetical protein